jgi:hypothetical protein
MKPTKRRRRNNKSREREGQGKPTHGKETNLHEQTFHTTPFRNYKYPISSNKNLQIVQEHKTTHHTYAHGRRERTTTTDNTSEKREVKARTRSFSNGEENRIRKKTYIRCANAGLCAG